MDNQNCHKDGKSLVRSESEYSLEKILSGFSGMNYYKKGLTKLLNLI